MSDRLWILLDANGFVAGQPITAGSTPSASGDNPAGLVEVEVERHGDLQFEEWNGRGWVPILEHHRVVRKIEAEAMRDVRIAAGCMTPSGRVDSDQASRDLISGSALMATIAKAGGSPFAVTWRLQDNSYVTLDADGMIGMGVAVGAHVSACYAASFATKDTLDEAVSLAAIQAVDIAAGYPAG